MRGMDLLIVLIMDLVLITLMAIEKDHICSPDL